MSDSKTISATENPLLARFNKIPPETFRIPSGGVLYNNGELDEEVVNGELIIYPMTTVDEITMRSPDMLFQGTAIEKVFNRCIPQIKKPFDMLSNDVDYLIVCLRMVTYGDKIEIFWECPHCAKSKNTEDNSSNTEYTVNQVRSDDVVERAKAMAEGAVNVRPTYVIDLNNFLRNSISLSLTEKFTLTLDSGEVVKLRPSTFGDMIKLHQRDISKITTPEEMVDFILDGVLSVVAGVDGCTNAEFIAEWAKKINPLDLRKIQDSISTANDWGMTQEYTFTCKKCNHESVQQIPLNPIDFFTAPSINQTKL